MREWPTREEWAEQRRTLYADQCEDIGWIDKLTELATPSEIAEAIHALEQMWRDMGRQMKTASREQHAGFEDFARECSDYTELRSERQIVNRALKLMRNGQLPILADEGGMITNKLFPHMHARMKQLHEEAIERRAQEKAQTPIDDDAWAKELEWRRKIEAWLNGDRYG
jgi:hypothetical protein